MPPETWAMPLVITVMSSELRQVGKKRADGQRGFRLAHENAGGDVQRLRAARAHEAGSSPMAGALMMSCMMPK